MNSLFYYIIFTITIMKNNDIYYCYHLFRISVYIKRNEHFIYNTYDTVISLYTHFQAKHKPSGSHCPCIVRQFLYDTCNPFFIWNRATVIILSMHTARSKHQFSERSHSPLILLPKASFSFRKLIPKKHSNDYLIYKFVIVHHFHHDLLYQTRIILFVNVSHHYLISGGYQVCL